MRREKIDVVNCHYLEAYFIHLVIAARLRAYCGGVVHGAEIDGYAVSSPVSRFLSPDHARCRLHRCVLGRWPDRQSKYSPRRVTRSRAQRH
jgi:hypothetical protein